MKIIKILSILVALMGVVHIGATFSPLISGKLVHLEVGTYHAMIYMSLMCGLLLVVLGGYIAWAIDKVTNNPILKPTLQVSSVLLLIDGIAAVCFMPHNPFAWTICVLNGIVGCYLLFRKSSTFLP